jgi:hypothetical protein
MNESRLLAETRRLLEQRDKSLQVISEETGINVHWLRKFSQGAFDDPGVNRIEHLYDYLRDEGSEHRQAG